MNDEGVFSSRRRRARQLHRRLAELDRIDARFGLGAAPVRAPRRRERRWSWFGMLLASVIVLTIVLGSPILDRLIPQQRPLSAADGSTTGKHAFINTVGSKPVTWNPCRPIEYSVSTENGPINAERRVRAAVGEVSAATGLAFEFTGTTDRRPGRYPSEVVIGWGSAEEFPRLRGEVAGLGGPTTTTPAGGGLPRYTGGMVVIDAEYAANARNVDHHAVLLHELGHLVGLAHVQDPRELMNARSSGVDSFGPGDLEGLAALGRGPCR